MLINPILQMWKPSLGTSKSCFQKHMGRERTEGIRVWDVTLHTHFDTGPESLRPQ